MSRFTRTLIALGAVASLALGSAGAAQARHGADDPVGHDRGDDHGVHHKHHKHHRHHHQNDD